MADSEGMQKMLPETDIANRKYARQPLCARTSYSCNKLFLFIYTLLFLVRCFYLLGLIIGLFCTDQSVMQLWPFTESVYIALSTSVIEAMTVASFRM